MTNRLDDAIDRAVREMMHVDPMPDMKGRVLSQLEHPRPRVFTFVRLGLATAVAVLILFALMRAPHPVPSSETRHPAAPAVPLAVPRNDPDPVASTFPLSSPERPVTAAVAVEAPTIPALPEIAPLVVAPPEATEIEPDAIIVSPLADIPDVRVDPLPFPPGSRD